MFYENDSEKERVEGIMDRLEDETFITINPAFCGNCKAFATEKFEQAFGAVSYTHLDVYKRQEL